MEASSFRASTAVWDVCVLGDEGKAQAVGRKIQDKTDKLQQASLLGALGYKRYAVRYVVNMGKTGQQTLATEACSVRTEEFVHCCLGLCLFCFIKQVIQYFSP